MIKHDPQQNQTPTDGVQNKWNNLLGLKWKVMLLSSLILLAIVIIFTAISYRILIDNFESQSTARYQRYIKEVNGLLDQTSQNLHQLAGLTPFLEGMNQGLLTADGASISAAFDLHWASLQLHNGVHLVRFYDKSSQLLASWGAPEPTTISTNDEILNWVRGVNEREHPISPLSCAVDCMQYAIQPLLIGGKNVGVIVIGAPLIDAVLGFENISGADIGLLIQERDGIPASGSSPMRIQSWKARVAALTNSEINLALLNQVAQQHPNLDDLFNGVEFIWDSSHQQIRQLPLRGITAATGARLIVITDTTATVTAIRSSTQQNVVIGLLGLLLSELLLFIILTKPLSRLKHIVFSLPLLARSDFQNFRTLLLSADQKQWLKDEIDLLDETAVALSHQLEKLESQVVDRTQALAKQMSELSRGKDFVSHLLDMAQVIVITQNASAEIMSLNAYGAKIIQFSEKDLQGTEFIELLVLEDDLHDLPPRLEQICLEQREQLRHETTTLCKDGSVRHIIWLHSRLIRHTPSDPAVLSVGLDITEHKQVESRLAWLADHDPLTHLFNRRRFQEELERILGLAMRYQRPGALLFFDLDQFKYINDTSGHQAGDALLKIVTNMLLRAVRNVDIIGRLGGDEFAVILPETTADGAIVVAKAVLELLGQARLTVNDRTHKASASIGIALFPEHGNNVHDLLAAADLAMYQAKDAGRGGFHLFSEGDKSRERMHSLVLWKEKIEHALLHDRFILYFQPIMHVKSKVISHCEALLRMIDDDGKVLAPGAFISAAERTGLIHEIDHMVLRKVIAQASSVNHNHSGQRINFSINLSAHAFNDPGLLRVLEDALEDNAATPTDFLFEITETAALEDMPAARKLIETIKALGCRFALDDFGVGFSTFGYIRLLPIDVVKIDGSFIKNLATSPDDKILVKALCDVARGFGKKTTAEFVEDGATLVLLEELQVDYAQGYFVGRPVSAQESFFKDFLAPMVNAPLLLAANEKGHDGSRQ